jgi:hypothetical protein
MCGWQLQTQRSPTVCGVIALRPHGSGSQGSTSIGSMAAVEKNKINNNAIPKWRLTKWFSDTVGERVPVVAWPARAGGDVVLDSTVGIGATYSRRARWATLVGLACFSDGAVRMGVAF